YFLIYATTLYSPLFPYTTLFRSHCCLLPARLNLGVLINADFLPTRPSATAMPLCKDSPIETERKSGNCQTTRMDLHNGIAVAERSEEHTSELQSRENLVCRLMLE